MGVGVVQGVHGGPPASLVVAFGGVQPLEQGPLSAFLHFGGKPYETEESPGSADGAFTAPGGGGHTALSAGFTQQGPAVASGAEVGRGRVCGRHREDGRKRDAATRGGDELVPDEQVVPSVDLFDVLEPALGGPPTRHPCIHTRRHRPAQQRPRKRRPAAVTAIWWTRPGATTARLLPTFSRLLLPTLSVRRWGGGCGAVAHRGGHRGVRRRPRAISEVQSRGRTEDTAGPA